MSRIVKKNEVVNGQFPIWQPGGYGKVTGLSEDDFDVNIYCDGAPIVDHDYNISEIVDGEYLLIFTPNSCGRWLCEVSYGNQNWVEECQVFDVSVSDFNTDLSIIKALVHDNVVMDNQEFNHEYRGRRYLTAARLRAYDSEANASDAGSTGLVHTYGISAEYHLGEQASYKVVRTS